MKRIVLISILSAIAAALPLFIGENPYITGIMISVLMMAALSSAWLPSHSFYQKSNVQ